MPNYPISFVPATRESVYARICVHGPGGAGKTYTGLHVMSVLCKGEPFAVIDTERGRSRKYANINGWVFNIWEPHTFAPDSLTEALGIAAGAGFPGVVIDSGSLFWNGAEGMTEQVDKFASSSSRNDKFGGWKEMAPIERRMWDAILTYPGHIWMTLRVTSHYVVEERQRGDRTVATPRKVGLKPVQREGFDYEFDLVGAMDQDNGFLVTKSDIITIPQGTFIEKPGSEFAEALAQFCAEGVETTGVMTYRSLGLAPDVTVEGLKDLHGEVSRAGLVNAPVTDEFGNPTVLGDLLRQRAVALTTAARSAAKAAAEAQVSAVSATQPMAPATPAAPARANVAEFRARILAASTAAEVRDLIADMQKSGLDGTESTTDADGATVTLGKLANQVGRRLAAAQQAAALTPPTSRSETGLGTLSGPEDRDARVTPAQLAEVDKLLSTIPSEQVDLRKSEQKTALVRELIGRYVPQRRDITQGEAHDLCLVVEGLLIQGDADAFREYVERPQYQQPPVPEQAGAHA